jgi:transcription elongation GreA/GreB family factor
MSRAFVKEGQETEEIELPDRLISSHPNLVTETGLAEIEAEVRRLSEEHAHAQSAGDRSALGAISRDLRYWTSRRASAEVVPAPKSSDEVRFGAVVMIEYLSEESAANRANRRQTFQIVGEDEAEPAKGKLSYVSPVARALLGARVEDILQLTERNEVRVVSIS